MPRASHPKMDPRVLEAIESFGSGVRVGILSRLIHEGPQTRGQLAEHLELNVRTVQSQLNVLRKLGVIEAVPLEEPDGLWHRIEYKVIVQKILTLYKILGTALGF